MTKLSAPEPWLNGPVPDVPPLLMPAAHALLHAREEAARALDDLTTDEIWIKPGGAASVGFHLRHLAGSLDRLLTYARGGMLSEQQRNEMKIEGVPGTPPMSADAIVEAVNTAVDRALAQIRQTPESSLLETRGVGRQQLPSNVLGLTFHAAEHATRHAGQAITTAHIVRSLR
jgi:uncharacterized damage-inducible protein DinB